MNLPNGGWRQPVGDVGVVDVRRGRISLNLADETKTVDVFYHYGFSGNLGVGSYERTPFLVRPDLAVSILEVPTVEPTVQSALATWAGLTAANTIIRIVDNATYVLPAPLNVDLTSGRKLTIESNDMRRPHLQLNGSLTVVGGGPDASLTLSGLLVEGTIDVTGYLGELPPAAQHTRPRPLDAEGDGDAQLLVDAAAGHADARRLCDRLAGVVAQRS